MTAQRPACSRYACTATPDHPCLYCDAPAGAEHEHDHFPVPWSAGGDQVEVTCRTCHKLKDSVGLDAINPTAFASALAELLDGLETGPGPVDVRRVMIALEPDVLQRWDRLSPMARIVYARERRVVEQLRAYRDGTTRTGHRQRLGAGEMGRPQVLSADDVEVARGLLAAEGTSVAGVARTLGVSRASLYRHVVGAEHQADSG